MSVVEILSVSDKIIIQFSDRSSVIYAAERLWDWIKNTTACEIVDITCGHNSIVLSPYPGKNINYHLVMSYLKTVVTPDREYISEPRMVTIPLQYSGEDLEYVSDFLHVSLVEFIGWHSGSPWVVSFLGFMPGFAYMVREDAYMVREDDREKPLLIPRRKSPRASVPAGSVALGGPYCGVYPLSSPGGWQLIGSTDTVLWELDASPPALLSPGMKVHFIPQ